MATVGYTANEIFTCSFDPGHAQLQVLFALCISEHAFIQQCLFSMQFAFFSSLLAATHNEGRVREQEVAVRLCSHSKTVSCLEIKLQ